MNIQCFWAWSICVPQSNICLYRKARLFYSSKIHLVARTGWLKSFRWANARCTAYGNILLRKRWLDFLLRCAVGQENIFAPKFRSASEKAFGEHFCSVGWLIVHMDSHLWFFVKAWSFHKCTCSFYDLSFVSTCQMQCLAVRVSMYSLQSWAWTHLIETILAPSKTRRWPRFHELEV